MGAVYMEIYIDDNMIKQVEKKLHSKCVFIDWRYGLYHFENGKILNVQDILDLQ